MGKYSWLKKVSNRKWANIVGSKNVQNWAKTEKEKSQFAQIILNMKIEKYNMNHYIINLNKLSKKDEEI